MQKLLNAYFNWLQGDKTQPFTFAMNIAKYEKFKGQISANKLFKGHTIERDFTDNTVTISFEENKASL